MEKIERKKDEIGTWSMQGMRQDRHLRRRSEHVEHAEGEDLTGRKARRSWGLGALARKARHTWAQENVGH